MTPTVLIAHAEGEEELAERLAGPIRAAGYEVAHHGTVMVGESATEEASKILSTGGPVVLCGTVKTVGTRWAHRLVNAARKQERMRVFPVHMEQSAFIEQLSLDSRVACYWEDADRATEELVASLHHHYPIDRNSEVSPPSYEIERRYRKLALEACDIIDLANLPESDRHLATRRLELRRLYVALRVQVEFHSNAEIGEEMFEVLEKRREEMRMGRWEKQGRSGQDRVPIGHRLSKARQLVVLGDPGAGKTTMVRWIATAYLLRLKEDPEWKALPDVATLPDQDWLPIVVRCRDLETSGREITLDNLLLNTLRRSEMTEDESKKLVDMLRDKLSKGEALLLVDGLDEISDPRVRSRFCEQLERIHAAYPNAPMVATSRIVGYREMGGRIGRGFEHVTVAELSEEDKNDFVRRWCAFTERPERKEEATQELIRDIHSTDRIERLTGNPMLLTTMALVKRKVGKLPSRRAELYWEAFQVLLRWRREVDLPIDQREARPQLAYIAYEMCDRGVQRLREDEVIELLEQVREEYPSKRMMQEHTPEEFLRLLERRTGILVKAGYVQHLSRSLPVFEFRHLTFQEYLAARALVDRCYPRRDESISLADHVASLAGNVTADRERASGNKGELAVVDNWREALRLCVAMCHDDDVDATLLAIAEPLDEEDGEVTRRPRAVLAALCLTDEPNVNDQTAKEVLETLIGEIHQEDSTGTAMDAAVSEVASSQWKSQLKACLLEAFMSGEPQLQPSIGRLYATVCAEEKRPTGAEFQEWIEVQESRISSGNPTEAAEAALSIMKLGTVIDFDAVPGLIPKLLGLVQGDTPAAVAGAWTLHNLSQGQMPWEMGWSPSPSEIEAITNVVEDGISAPYAAMPLLIMLGRHGRELAVEPLIGRLKSGSKWMRSSVAGALGRIGDERAVEALLSRLEDESESERVRSSAADALGRIGDERAVEALLSRLEDESESEQVRSSAADALGQIGDERAVEALLSRLEDESERVRSSATDALGRIGDERAVEALLSRLEHGNPEARKSALRGLANGREETDRKLLTRDLDDLPPYLDPRDEIGEEQVRKATRQLGLEASEVRRRYEEIAQQIPLVLSWESRQTF